MDSKIHGVIEHTNSVDKADYLYRISLKGVILNNNREVLLVRESGRKWWDLPGGGMDHGEDIKTAIAREMKEEVNLTGDFTYQILRVDDPTLLEHSNILQVRLIFIVRPAVMKFSPGDDGDDVAFMSLERLRTIDESEYDYLKKIVELIP